MADNHIFPLFWMHGEDGDILRNYMNKVKQSGIDAVCLEARPHPDFVGPKWWEELGIILEEAKKLDMKIWILDDSHFPTGYANGAIKKKYPQFRKRFLKLHQLDFYGPMKHAQAWICHALPEKEDKLEGVFLAKKIGYEEIDPQTIMDITKNVRQDTTVSFELPEGEWTLLICVSTFAGGEEETENYLNPIVPESVDVLIQEVYEAHYNHYKEEFGRTILGFFSDEPRFGNIAGFYGTLGRCDMVLPWREDMVTLLAEKVGKAARKLLPLLFVEGGESAAQIRFQYMDTVSESMSFS